ncbi:hypothetical protein K449DRAFT_386857 [Hypoxylon sp. EC38]|nr:hypothetical protein K449DRAFT_386857 [Hypoxylon sp. EC38]
MPSPSSPGFYPVVDVNYRGPRADLSDILDDINRVNALLYEDIAKLNILATREREEEQKVAKNITAPKAREDEMTPDEESAKFILQKVEQGFDEIMLLIKEKIQQELGTHRLTDTGKRGAGERKIPARSVQRLPSSSQPSHTGHFSESPVPTANTLRKLLLSEDGQSLAQRPTNVPQPPAAYAGTESGGQTATK